MINRFFHESVVSSSETENTTNQGHISMSDIAARLRQVHMQMQKKKPVLREELELIAEQVQRGSNIHFVNERLDEISQAIISEHQARNNDRKFLLDRLGEIETICNATKVDQKKLNLLNTEIIKDIELKFKNAVEEALNEHAKKNINETQKEKQDINRQLREATAVSHYSLQIAALERQISDIQNKLNLNQPAIDKPLAGSVLSEEIIPLKNAEPVVDDREKLKDPLNIICKNLAQKKTDKVFDNKSEGKNIYAQDELIASARQAASENINKKIMKNPLKRSYSNKIAWSIMIVLVFFVTADLYFGLKDSAESMSLNLLKLFA